MRRLAPRRRTRSLDVLPSLPVRAQIEVELAPAERRELARLAERLLAEDPALGALTAFGPRVRAGAGAVPSVFLEDHVEITLFHVSGDASLEYRALLLAGDGDVVLVGGERRPEFEAYCRDVLGLGAPEVLTVHREPSAPKLPLALRVLRECQVLTRLIGLARRHGGLNLVPYYGTSSAWALASVLADSARVPVRVLAAPPKLTAHANDKLWFARRVAEVLGRDARPSTTSAGGPEALAEILAGAADRSGRLVVKLPDSASSVGNVVVEAAAVRAEGAEAVAARVTAHLRGIGWEDDWPLLVSVWDEPVLESPSVQLWIPPLADRADGAAAEGPDPIVEGVFTQWLAEGTGQFLGGAPSRLPARVRVRLAQEALYLGALLQALGYVGRCSFDAVMVGTRPETATPHWIECNGRWGGMSIPLTVANRLCGDWSRHPFTTLTHHVPRAARLDELLAGWDDLLLRPGRRDEGIVVLSPGPFEAGQRCHLLSTAAPAALASALDLRV